MCVRKPNLLCTRIGRGERSNTRLADNFGLMPYRRTIVSVCELLQAIQPNRGFISDDCPVGRPIHVTKTEKPTTEQVMEVHAKYIAELTRYGCLLESS